MIDHHYGHLAHDSRQHAVSLLEALALERAVDAAWTSTTHTAEASRNQRITAAEKALASARGRLVDAAPLRP